MKQTQNIIFKLIVMPCCSHQLCWVNPRLPSHCPECGISVYMQLKFHGDEHIIVNDEKAQLITHS